MYVLSPGFTTTTATTTTSTTLAVTCSTKSYHLLSICCVVGMMLIKNLGRICMEPNNSLHKDEQEFTSKLSNLQTQSMEPLSSPFYREGNGGSEKLSSSDTKFMLLNHTAIKSLPRAERETPPLSTPHWHSLHFSS